MRSWKTSKKENLPSPSNKNKMQKMATIQPAHENRVYATLDNAISNIHHHLSTLYQGNLSKRPSIAYLPQPHSPFTPLAKLAAVLSNLATNFFTFVHSSFLALSLPPKSGPTSKTVTAPSIPPAAILLPSI